MSREYPKRTLMHLPTCIGTLIACLPLTAIAELPLPSVDLRIPADAPKLTTWAHPGETAAIHIESPASLDLTCDIYQIDGNIVIPISRNQILPPLIPGANLLKIPLPEKSERGKILFKIVSAPEGTTIASLITNILPKDAWASLSNHAKAGNVFIDPSLKAFKAWAASHDIPSTAITPERQTAYFFGKPAENPNTPPPGRFIIFESKDTGAIPTIETLTTPEFTKIILPPGFLENLPDSATAQALLLKHLFPVP